MQCVATITQLYLQSKNNPRLTIAPNNVDTKIKLFCFTPKTLPKTAEESPVLYPMQSSGINIQNRYIGTSIKSGYIAKPILISGIRVKINPINNIPQIQIKCFTKTHLQIIPQPIVAANKLILARLIENKMKRSIRQRGKFVRYRKSSHYDSAPGNSSYDYFYLPSSRTKIQQNLHAQRQRKTQHFFK